MNDSLRLSDILARNVMIEWFEAVALVREVADRVRDNLGGHSVPELHHVQLAADGGISVAGATKTHEPVRRLGQLLQAVLTQADPPVQLRLLVSQATAPDPAFGSVREYSEALGYFERPDRTGVLRGLFSRAILAPVPQDESAQTIDAIAPLRDPEETVARTRAAPPDPVSRRRAVGAMAAVIVLVSAVTAYWKYAGEGANARKVTEIAVKASDAVGTALVSGLSSVSERVGLGRLASTDSAGAVPPAGPVPAPPPVTPHLARRPIGAAPLQLMPLQVFDLESSVAASAPPEPRPVAPDPGPAAPGSEPAPPELDATVYSATDAVVVPPVGVRPQLPRALPPNVSRDRLGQIELIILPDGTVGSVKLLAEPSSVRESMLLSAAKAWRFTPALKDGHPVTYRKVVWLVLQ